MSTQVQRRRGTTADHSTFTGAAGEVTVDTSKNVVVVHDGSTAGGHPAATEAAVALKANIASPTFTGTPAAPTATAGTNTTQIATTAFVTTAVAASGGVSDGDKGDITVSGSGATWTIDNGAVTLAKLVDATATSRVLGRKTAGSGDFEELTASEVADFIGSTRGAIMYRGASGWNALAPGTSGYVLTSNGSGADPTYQASSGGGAPGGSSGQVQYNNGGAFGGAANLEISSGAPVIVSATAVTPSSGRVSLYGDSYAGRHMAGYKSPLGAARPMQAHLGSTRVEWWQARDNSVTPFSFGGTISGSGTFTARALAGGSTFFAWQERVSSVSSATAGNAASHYGTRAKWSRGDVAGCGGFTATFRFGVNDAATVANSRMLVGFVASTSISNVEPSSLTNIIGVGCDAGETTLSIIHNDATGTATKVSLGASFPSQALSTDVYELRLYCAPNGSAVGYEVIRANTGDSASGTLSSDIPAATTLMAPMFWRNNGSTALAVDICMMSFFCERDS